MLIEKCIEINLLIIIDFAYFKEMEMGNTGSLNHEDINHIDKVISLKDKISME